MIYRDIITKINLYMTTTILETSFPGEAFKIVPGYENYAVSNYGRIMRMTYGPQTEPGRIKKPQVNSKNGYCHVKMTGSEGKKSMLLHRLVAKAFIPNPNGYREIDHIDRNKENNHVDNLRWCTRRENLTNMVHKQVKNIWAFPPDGSEPIFFLTIRDAAEYIRLTTGMVYFPQGIANVLNRSHIYPAYKGWRFKHSGSSD